MADGERSSTTVLYSFFVNVCSCLVGETPWRPRQRALGVGIRELGVYSLMLRQYRSPAAGADFLPSAPGWGFTGGGE